MRHPIAFLAIALSTTSASALVPLNVTSHYTSYSEVGDHRNPGGNDKFTISTFDFIFGLRAFNDSEYRATIQATLPLRTLQMSAGSSANIGSEIGGYRVAWNQTFFDFLGWDLSYGTNASPKLGLFADNTNFETSAGIKTANFLTPSTLVRAVIGPGVRLSSNLGLMYLAKANIEAIWQNGMVGKLAMGINAQFRHREALNANLAANLFTLQPEVAWEIVKDLWISVQYTRALARPVGFEQAMGDASIMGLYGDAVSFGLSTATF